MSSALLYALAGVALCGIGLAGFLLLNHLLRRLLAFNLIGSGVFLVLVGRSIAIVVVVVVVVGDDVVVGVFSVHQHVAVIVGSILVHDQRLL